MTKKSLLTLIESEVWQFSALCMAFTVPSTKRILGCPLALKSSQGESLDIFLVFRDLSIGEHGTFLQCKP